VIVAECQVNDRANCYRVVAVFIRHDQWLLGNPTHSHDGGVRLIDDGKAEDSAELSGIGYGKSRTFDIFRLELFVAGAFAQVGDAALEAEEIEVASVLENGNDQSP